MSTFFQQTAQAMIAKHIDRFPLLKLDQVIDWQPIEQYLNRQRTRYLRDHRGRPAYPLLSMFKAVLLGQWHSLSDPELEHSLITRIDFNLFCRFDELSIPDYSTLCRYRNWLAQDDTLSELLELINRQLAEKNLKVEKASAAVVDATIIQTAGSKQRQAIEVDEEGQVSGQTTPSKDKDARWTKKNGLYRLGYKQHTRTDEEGYIEKLQITPANTHECNHLSPLPPSVITKKFPPSCAVLPHKRAKPHWPHSSSDAASTSAGSTAWPTTKKKPSLPHSKHEKPNFQTASTPPPNCRNG